MRQLRHVLRLAACTAENGVITEADLDLPPGGTRPTQPDFETAERHVIAETLRQHGGRVADAARALKVSRATLYRKIRALGIAAARRLGKTAPAQLSCLDDRRATMASRIVCTPWNAPRR